MKRHEEKISETLIELGVASVVTKGSPVGAIPDQEHLERLGTGICED